MRAVLLLPAVHQRWAFTLSNAGSSYFEDRADLSRLDELDWQAIDARDWRRHKEGKRAEFLVEGSFSWWLIDRIGVCSEQVLDRARAALRGAEHQPRIEVVRTWYYWREESDYRIQDRRHSGRGRRGLGEHGELRRRDGRGIALQFKNAFPENFTAYAAACRRREVRPGRMFVFETRQLAAPRYVINFPTKRHWRNRSRMDDIDAGLRALRRIIRDKGIRSVAVPPLGSGLGGLRWRDVRARIEAELRALGDDVRVIVFEPRSASEPLPGTTSALRPKMTRGRAALVGLTSRYRRGMLDPFLTLLEVHKLMYFMKASGEPALERLRVVKARYGPYAENLPHVLRGIEGHLIEGYGDGGDAPHRTLKIKPGAEAKAEKFLGRNPETRDRFDRVAQLVDGFESPFGLERLSTVHWVMTNESRETSPKLNRRPTSGTHARSVSRPGRSHWRSMCWQRGGGSIPRSSHQGDDRVAELHQLLRPYPQSTRAAHSGSRKLVTNRPPCRDGHSKRTSPPLDRRYRNRQA